MAQNQGATWGVHFDNTTATTAFYSLFYSANGTYASSVQTGYYPLPSGLCYSSSTVPAGTSLNVIFSGITGGINPSGTNIGLQLMSNGGCSTATSSAAGGVSQTGSGEIFFDNFNRSNL